MEKAGRAVRGVFVCRVSERHECGHQHGVRETTSHGHYFFLMYDSVEIKLARKKVYGCFVGSMMKLFDEGKKIVRLKVETSAY